MQLWAKIWLNSSSNGGITGLAPMEVLQRTSSEATWSNHRLRIQGAAKLTIPWTRLSLSLELNPESQETTWSKWRLRIHGAAKMLTSWARLRSGNQTVRLSLELKFRVQMDKKEKMERGMYSCRFTSLAATISIGNSSFQHFLVPTKMRPFKNSASFLKQLADFQLTDFQKHLANFQKEVANFLHQIKKFRTNKLNKILLGLIILTKTAGGNNHSLSPEIMAKLNPVGFQGGFCALGEKMGHQAAFNLETDLSKGPVRI